MLRCAHFDMKGGLQTFAALGVEVCSADKDEAARAAMALVADGLRQLMPSAF
ncbi:hypothetical protein OAN307_c25600 [Octadecabacter antarcticus 307]|uniref:Uncharacterized protein n=1 Tax=Octadecabacter antarcticus 307 TaxID=391626 RepID=M9R7F4_9RHOB|nr:hypothetical protein [Octadecabacter antarcticus]AGI68157.1 hypothetical protein OAN307_c25600 [Octadecabacter antarcticus 307]